MMIDELTFLVFTMNQVVKWFSIISMLLATSVLLRSVSAINYYWTDVQDVIISESCESGVWNLIG